MENRRVQLQARVRGRVQGVGFRFFVLETGRRLGLAGWVRNAADGSVEVLAEGSRTVLEDLLTALRRGPRAARVDEVEHSWEAAEPHTGEGFEVRS